MKMESRTVPIKGMHCKSCTIIVADELNKIDGVKQASASLRTNTATIRFTREPSDAEIERAIDAAGYIVGFEKKKIFSRDKSVYVQFIYSFVIIFVVLSLIKLLGFSGISLSGLGDDKAVTALIIGLTAGFSTCMALVGGLVLGLSARYAEKHQTATSAERFRPHLFFNLGRITSFFVLGGVIGLLGSLFELDSSATGLLTIAIGIVMIVIGLQLTELFPKLSSKNFTLPAGIAKLIGLNKHREKEYSHKNAFILGGLTFFLPCGFTQAMQLVAIASGDFLIGAVVMGLFAIGTAPGLLSVGGLVSVIKGSFAKKFFRFAGVLVVLLALYNITNGFNLMGYNFSLGFSQQGNSGVESKDAIILKTTFNPLGGSQDISPKVFNVETGKRYVLEVEAKEDGQGCMSTIMIPGLYKTPKLITKGTVRLPFKVDKPGTYQITCAMGIVRGSVIATNGG